MNFKEESGHEVVEEIQISKPRPPIRWIQVGQSVAIPILALLGAAVWAAPLSIPSGLEYMAQEIRSTRVALFGAAFVSGVAVAGLFWSTGALRERRIAWHVVVVAAALLVSHLFWVLPTSFHHDTSLGIFWWFHMEFEIAFTGLGNRLSARFGLGPFLRCVSPGSRSPPCSCSLERASNRPRTPRESPNQALSGPALFKSPIGASLI